MSATMPMTALGQVRAAVQANFLPGLVLWSCLAALLAAYASSASVQAGLAQWGLVKQAWGYPFAFASYVVFAVVVPEALGFLVLKQTWSPGKWREMGYAALVFGTVGVTVDMFYALQVSLFGEGHDSATLAKKMVFDQFVYSPVSNWFVVALFAWRENGYHASTWRVALSAHFMSTRYLPMLVALWCVWIPSVLVIYFMPTALQFPVASIVLSFWILIFKFIRKS
ncbi:hypothetical protein [Rhodoferax aquaticus]|uniref:Uncharacterized protein n=1 Tax=Rhodoferax aquaticus TaxID=2527691 RepID=A0A515EJF8_9BURK|nr:hypothetical protein [Rhodoferax aquaticus]QDL52804.1 hypothetical protein EXZ61_00655 [Rhodoferax aquaticus]